MSQLLNKHTAPREGDSKFTNNVKATLHASLQERHQDLTVRKFLNTAAFLDPRFRHLRFLSTDERPLRASNMRYVGSLLLPLEFLFRLSKSPKIPQTFLFLILHCPICQFYPTQKEKGLITQMCLIPHSSRKSKLMGTLT